MKLNFTKSKQNIAALMTVLVGVAVLLCSFFNIYIFRCIPKAITGYDCPFCGAQRAIHHTLHGNFKVAFLSNPYLFIILPYIIVLLLCIFKIIPEGSKVQKIAYSKPVIILAGIATIAWWIIRNTAFMKKFLIFVGI